MQSLAAATGSLAPPEATRAFAHLLRAGLAGIATLGPDGVVRSREGVLSAWLPGIGCSCFDSPVLSGLDEDLAALRVAPGEREPLMLPGVRLASAPSSPRCHILITWHAGAGEHAVLTTIDQIDRPIDHWVLLQKREQRLLEEKLIVASRELERVNEDLRQFTSIAAHDLQAPLRQITAFAGLLRGTLDDATADTLDCLDTIEGCASRLTKMISGLLDHARLSSKQVTFERVDLSRVLADACNNLGGEIAACGAHVSVGPLPEVFGVSDLLTNLFQNLIANSLRYRSPERPSRIVVEMVGETGIAVSDNGIGVPAAYADAIFGSFVRVPRRGPSEGVGLGLGLCRKIAELHGWGLFLDKGHAPGARFRIDGIGNASTRSPDVSAA